MYLQSCPAYSLLAYCYYQLENYVQAADCYEQLIHLQQSPGGAADSNVDTSRLYFAQSLYKAGLLAEAMNVSSQIDNPAYRPQVHLNE